MESTSSTEPYLKLPSSSHNSRLSFRSVSFPVLPSFIKSQQSLSALVLLNSALVGSPLLLSATLKISTSSKLDIEPLFSFLPEWTKSWSGWFSSTFIPLSSPFLFLEKLGKTESKLCTVSFDMDPSECSSTRVPSEGNFLGRDWAILFSGDALKCIKLFLNIKIPGWILVLRMAFANFDTCSIFSEAFEFSFSSLGLPTVWWIGLAEWVSFSLHKPRFSSYFGGVWVFNMEFTLGAVKTQCWGHFPFLLLWLVLAKFPQLGDSLDSSFEELELPLLFGGLSGFVFNFILRLSKELLSLPLLGGKASGITMGLEFCFGEFWTVSPQFSLITVVSVDFADNSLSTDFLSTGLLQWISESVCFFLELSTNAELVSLTDCDKSLHSRAFVSLLCLASPNTLIIDIFTKSGSERESRRGKNKLTAKISLKMNRPASQSNVFFGTSSWSNKSTTVLRYFSSSFWYTPGLPSKDWYASTMSTPTFPFLNTSLPFIKDSLATW